MKDRIKALRKSLKMTQQEFADKIGSKRNTVAKYEMGRNEPIDVILMSICREFNVNEEWLRYGTGEMLADPIEFDNIIFAKKYNKLDPMAKKIIKTFMELNEKEMKMVYKFTEMVMSEEDEQKEE